MLGALAGTDAGTANTNYGTAFSTSIATGPDFIPAFLTDACENVVKEIVQAICETRFHPERVDYATDTASLASGASLPVVNGASVPLVGVMGRVRDASDDKTLIQVSLDRVRNYTRFANIYSAADLYLYAIDDGAGVIEHTRTNVKIEWPALATPAYVAGNNVPLRNWHKRAVVAGIITHAAPKEDMFAGLLAAEQAMYAAHLTQIQAVGNQESLPSVAKTPSIQ